MKKPEKPTKMDPWTGKHFELKPVEKDLLVVSLGRADDLMQRANELAAQAKEVRRQAVDLTLFHAKERIGLTEARPVDWKLGEDGMPTGFTVLEAKAPKPQNGSEKQEPVPAGT